MSYYAVSTRPRPRNQTNWRSKHHLTPRCHYKPSYLPSMNSAENLLMLWRNKHNAWHELFKEASLEQIIATLKRVQRMKGRKYG
jgi:hypothetical protein